MTGRTARQHIDDERKHDLNECRRLLGEIVEIRANDMTYEQARIIYEHAFCFLLRFIEKQLEWDL